MMSIYIYIFIMALITYCLRAVPLALFRRPIRNRLIRSFLHYVPYACLTAMTFPAILYDSPSVFAGIAALVVAVILAFRGKSLITVALGTVGAVLASELVLMLM